MIQVPHMRHTRGKVAHRHRGPYVGIRGMGQPRRICSRGPCSRSERGTSRLDNRATQGNADSVHQLPWRKGSRKGASSIWCRQ